MTKLDVFVSELSLFSDAPILALYEMEKKIHFVNNDVDLETGVIFDEMLYFLLTDLNYGYEGYLKRLNMDDDLELIKDIIAFDCSSKSKMELHQRIQKIKVDIEMGEYNNVVSNKLKTYLYSGMSLIDDDYISHLVKHLISVDKFEVDFLVALITKRIKGRKKNILKIS